MCMTIGSSPTPRVLGVIPARGGSRRLPRKNLLAVGGHPLIAHTIMAAQGAASLTDYVVSSEDDEILNVAQSYGASTPFVRPAELATDRVRNIDTCIHALHQMENLQNTRYDMVVLLQPTCPIRKSSHIDQAVELLWTSELPTLASVKGPFKKRDPNLKKICNGALVDYCGTEVIGDWEPFYIYNASIYAAKREYLVNERKLVSARQVPLVMDAFYSADIDDIVDVYVVEAFMKHLREHEKEDSDA